jgi:hypothetical protein
MGDCGFSLKKREIAVLQRQLKGTGPSQEVDFYSFVPAFPHGSEIINCNGTKTAKAGTELQICHAVTWLL